MLRQARLAPPIALVGISLLLISCERSTVVLTDDKPTLTLTSPTSASSPLTPGRSPPATSVTPWDPGYDSPWTLKLWSVETQTLDRPNFEYRVSPQLGWTSPRPDAPGVLTEVRWSSSVGAVGHSLYLNLYIDRDVGGSPDLRVPIRYELRDAATSFKEGEHYRVPLGTGIEFQKTFTIVFGSRPNLTTLPPPVPKAKISGIAVVWRDSWKPAAP
jgi:hypothetical protein